MFAGMNIFVAFFLLLRILAESTPPSSQSVPLLGKRTTHDAVTSLTTLTRPLIYV